MNELSIGIKQIIRMILVVMLIGVGVVTFMSGYSSVKLFFVIVITFSSIIIYYLMTVQNKPADKKDPKNYEGDADEILNK